MGKIANRVSLQDVAKAVGCHVSTVSLALRDDPRLPERTRARVKRAADQLGYRTNPLVAAWLRQVRQPEVARAGAGIAFFLGNDGKDATAPDPFYQALVEGARSEAAALGYLVSETRFRKGDDARLLKTIGQLRYRGVRGILLFDPQENLSAEVVRELETGFAVVVMLRCGGAHRFHRVGTDIGGNVALALARLREMGCRRIALPIHPSQSDRVRKEAVAAYLWQQQQWPKKDRVPLPPDVVEFSRERFVPWVRAVRPDALLSVYFPGYPFLVDAGFRIPGDLVFAHIGSDTRPWLTGVVNRGLEVGRAAVFQLAGLLTGNRFGVPEIPLNTLIPGVWNDPGNAPDPAATAPRKGRRTRKISKA
jgi:LacI family transcriptional regulator